MAISMLRSPVADAVHEQLVQWFLHELFSGGLPPSWIGLVPEECALSYPVPVIELELDDPFVEKGASVDQQTGWLSIVLQDGEPFGLVEAEVVGNRLAYRLNRGPYAVGISEAVGRAAKRKEVRDSAFTLFIVRIPGAFITLLLLRGDQDVLIPVAPTFLPADVDWSVVAKHIRPLEL